MSNLLLNPVDTLKEKIQSQLQLLIESKTKLSIHLDVLRVDLRRDLNTDYLSKQARINHLEKAENNLIEHIYFMEDLLIKLG